VLAKYSGNDLQTSTKQINVVQDLKWS